MPDNQQSYWNPSQLVVANGGTSDMTSLTQGIYQQLGQLVQQHVPCILSYGADNIPTAGTISVAAGSYAFTNDNSMPFNSGPIFGNAASATISYGAGNNGYIVARYSVNIVAATENYTFPVTYMFLLNGVGYDAIYDCLVCVINSDTIVSYGPYYHYDINGGASIPPGITRPSLPGIPQTQTTHPESIAIINDLGSIVKTKISGDGLQRMSAIYDTANNRWAVTISGIILLSSGDNQNFFALLDLTSVFGITNITPISTGVGVVSPKGVPDPAVCVSAAVFVNATLINQLQLEMEFATATVSAPFEAAFNALIFASAIT